MNQKFRTTVIPVHPFLLSLYPALALLAYNIQQIEPRAALRSVFFSILFILILFLILWLVTRSLGKAGLLASIFAGLFFSFGHAYNFFRQAPVLDSILGKQSILSVVYLVILCGTSFWVLRRLKETGQLTRILNVFSVILVILPAVQIGSFLVSSSQSSSLAASKVPLQQQLTAPVGQPIPDIYFIILDTYTNQGLLKSEMNFDNSAFITQLEQLGFVVENCSQSNYTQTELSLSSILNLNYLPALDPRYVSGFMDRSDLPALIKQSLVRRSLDQLGYQTVSFGTGYNWSEIRDADIFFYPGANGLSWLGNQAGLNQFEAMYIRTTGGQLLSTIQTPAINDWARAINHPFQDHINIQLFLLDTLSKVPQISGPKFVFTHILIPHGPFVFGPNGVLPQDQMVGSTEEDGSDLKPADYIKGYVPQVEYINNQILPILKSLIEKSKTPPIIIIQGDHGPFSLPPILNAYYLPGKKDVGLYPTITPVNSFRLIFNAYFGTQYPLLPDTSFKSFDSDPFGGKLYPNSCSTP
jgi:hypothetical protein